ncbi:MAG: NHL repeat-containing protein [Planctomycetota bacterium]
MIVKPKSFMVPTVAFLLMSFLGCSKQDDSPEGQAPDSDSNSQVSTETDQEGAQNMLYLATANGLTRLDESGQHDVIVGGVTNSYCLQVSEGKLYASAGRGTWIRSYSLAGEPLREFAVPDEAKGFLDFACLPGDRFALLNNRKDQIYFVDHAGTLITTVPMGTPSNRLQSLDTVIVDNSLYVVEVEKSRVLEVRLDTYEASVFRDLSARLNTLSCIAYSPHTGLFYASDQDRGLYSFNKTEPIERVGNARYGMIADVEIDYPRAYIMGTKGMIRVMDLQTGLPQELCDLHVRTRSMDLQIASGRN